MKENLKSLIQDKISRLKADVSTIITSIEFERKENIGEDKIIYQHFEDKKEILLSQIMELRESLSELEMNKTQEYTISNKGRKRTVSIVTPILADPAKGLISAKSPLAKALNNKKKGDTVSVETPMGVSKYKVV